MSIHVALNHVTHYRYDRLVGLSPQVVRLRPAPHCRTRIFAYSLKVTPPEHFINWQQDPQANYLARLVFPDDTRELKIEVDLVAEMSVLNPFDFFLTPHAEQFPFKYDSDERRELVPFLVKAPAAPLVANYLAGVSRQRRRTIDFIVELNSRLANDIQYLIRLEPGVQLPEETLAKGSGSCRDSAALLVQLMRHLGLAARFVSGYLIQLVADVKSLDGPIRARRRISPTCMLGAKCTCRAPAGSDSIRPPACLPAKGTSRWPARPEPSAAAPISGAVDECETSFEHRMSVQAHLGGAARHQALQRRRVVGHSKHWAARWTRILRRHGRAADDGRRADVRLHRRSGRRGMEHRRAGREQTPAGRGSVSAAEKSICACGPRAFRAGQVVSRRAAAALVAELLLAQGRRAAVAEPESDRR